MTDTYYADRGLPGPANPHDVLHHAASRLTDRFAGHFAAETIDRYLFESYTALRRTSTVTTHLALLAETFATERLTALAQSKGTIVTTAPEVLFVCVHNAGRSQMAAGLLAHHAAGRVHVRSAGSQPADQLNPAVVEAMAEIGLDISAEFPKPLTDDVVRAADVVITMGCGDACPLYPGKRYLDWALDDPAGQGIEAVRTIRNDIDRRVQALLRDLVTDDRDDTTTEELA